MELEIDELCLLLGKIALIVRNIIRRVYSSATIDRSMADTTVYHLSDLWTDSRGDPLTLFESADPSAQAGSYVIEPGARVPERGTTSHDGDELSVVLSGTVELVLDGEETIVGPETLTVIPANTPHYSENRGTEPVRLVYVILGEL